MKGNELFQKWNKNNQPLRRVDKMVVVHGGAVIHGRTGDMWVSPTMAERPVTIRRATGGWVASWDRGGRLVDVAAVIGRGLRHRRALRREAARQAARAARAT